jgi:hypothetical protein
MEALILSAGIVALAEVGDNSIARLSPSCPFKEASPNNYGHSSSYRNQSQHCRIYWRLDYISCYALSFALGLGRIIYCEGDLDFDTRRD